MKKKLYYVVDKETTDVDGFEDVTGNKIVTVYKIEKNIPKQFFTLDLELSQNSEEEIQEYLDNNGFDDVFEFIKL